MRTISNLFCFGISTACEIINEVNLSIKLCLMSKYVTMPRGDRLATVLQGFEDMSGRSQIDGAIDGSHIPIKAPRENGDAYYTGKDFTRFYSKDLIPFSSLLISLLAIQVESMMQEFYLTVDYLRLLKPLGLLFPVDLDILLRASRYLFYC